MLRFFIFLIRVQWIDRLATSAFLIGITIQTGLLTLAVFRTASGPGDALVLATRSAMLTCVAIVLLSAMSSVQNEFRYGTISRLLLSSVPFARLLWIRSAASAVVASPAIVVPFIGAAAAHPELLTIRTLVLVVMVYVCLGAICYQSTLLLCQFRNPAAAVPWLRVVLLFFGMSVIPFTGSATLSLLFPTGWLLQFAHGGGAWADVIDVFAFAVCTALWTGLLWVALRNRYLDVIERNLTDSSEAT